jgi:hypothetical protein
MNREFAILNKECEIGLLDTQYNAMLYSDSINRQLLKDLRHAIDDAYDELLDLYQEQLDELLYDLDTNDEEISIAATHTVQRMAEICAIMFE